jgi:hypothetical protein
MKILFPSEILIFNPIICSQLILESHTEHSFSVTLKYYKSYIVSNNTQVPTIINFIRMMQLKNVKYTLVCKIKNAVNDI